MKLLNRSENTASGRGRHEDVQLQKVIGAANFTPVDYVHTPEFEKAVANAPEFERQIVKNMKLDDLNVGWRDPCIEAESAAELSFGKKQYINHVTAIKDIIDLQNCSFFF